MYEKAIKLRADLVHRLETIASVEGLSLNDVVFTLLESRSPEEPTNWALALAETMAAAPVEWRDVPDLSAGSRRVFKEDRYQDWLDSQQTDSEDG